MADKHRAQRAPKGQAGSTLVEISETLDNDVANVMLLFEKAKKFDIINLILRLFSIGCC